MLLQNVIDMRKRLLGPPQGGDLISIVTTDIQGYSGRVEGVGFVEVWGLRWVAPGWL